MLLACALQFHALTVWLGSLTNAAAADQHHDVSMMTLAYQSVERIVKLYPDRDSWKSVLLPILRCLGWPEPI